MFFDWIILILWDKLSILSEIQSTAILVQNYKNLSPLRFENRYSNSIECPLKFDILFMGVHVWCWWDAVIFPNVKSFIFGLSFVEVSLFQKLQVLWCQATVKHLSIVVHHSAIHHYRSLIKFFGLICDFIVISNWELSLINRAFDYFSCTFHVIIERTCQ